MADEVHEKILSELKSLNENVQKQGERTRRMERLLIGDKEFMQKGLIHEVRETQQELIDTNYKIVQNNESFERYKSKETVRKAKQTGLVLGASIGGGGLGAWLKSLFGG